MYMYFMSYMYSIFDFHYVHVCYIFRVCVCVDCDRLTCQQKNLKLHDMCIRHYVWIVVSL